MLENFEGKKVEVLVSFADMRSTNALPIKLKGTLTAFNDEAIILNNSTYISKKYIIKIELI